MCGIFGYIGEKKDAGEIVIEGLKKLEYRGYDSWGVAMQTEKKIKLKKDIGKISGVSAKDVSDPSSLAIAHSRWATHGGVTVENAHPHMDCKEQIAVLHNGIVENFAQIKEELVKKNHRFSSQTDTEVIVHLIEENMKTEGFATSVREAFNRLRGMNAIVVLNAASKQIVAAKTGSPLIVGQNEDGFYLASDASGIIKHTNKLLFLKDKEMVILGDDLQLLQLPNGEQIQPNFEYVDWKTEDVTKGSYEHFMLKEIYEQPTVIRNIALRYSDDINSLAAIIDKAKGTFFIGSGTAFHACLVGSYLFSKIVKKHVNTAAASEFNYLEDFFTEKSLIIALSQSGETIDVVEPLIRAKDKKSKIFAITNALGSTIYRMADYKMLLGAGPEKAVASTKAYIAKLSILFLLSFAMNKDVKNGKKYLMDAALEVERLLQKKNVENVKTIASFLNKAEHIYTIGRGLSYPTSMEAALKIKEVSYVHTEGLAGGELKHGTIALISKGVPCIVFAPLDETYEAIISNATEIKARGGVIIGIGSKRSDIFDYFIEVKEISYASIITHSIPAQLLAYFMALEKGYDPDKPRNLAKSVTVK